jgi:hypothetical protein
MNREPHFWLTLAIACLGGAAAAAIALQAGDMAALTLAAGAYALGAYGHFTLLAMLEPVGEQRAPHHKPTPLGLRVTLSLIWPVTDLWLFAWCVLPAPRAERVKP